MQAKVNPRLDIKTIKSPEQCFSWWMIHSFLYYRCDNPVISDKDFDTLTYWVKMTFNSLNHIHKHLVNVDDLKAGSGYAIAYPLMVQSSAMRILREIESPALQTTLVPIIKGRVDKHSKSNKTFDEYDSLFT